MKLRYLGIYLFFKLINSSRRRFGYPVLISIDFSVYSLFFFFLIEKIIIPNTRDSVSSAIQTPQNNNVFKNTLLCVTPECWKSTLFSVLDTLLQKQTSKSLSDSSMGLSLQGLGGGLYPLISSYCWWQT